MTTPYTYDRFQPGAMLGVWEETMNAELIAQWSELFGAHDSDTAARSHGLTVACMMRAYLGVVSPRPPGNIHARQKLSIIAPPKVDEAIRNEVWCVGKELRKERRYLTIEVKGDGEGGRPLYTGELSLIWAA